ncbi:MAG: deoxyribonuclease IV [Propionibacteriaceae bacterium]|jgi:deoxyribonuclease-4|nr:deoxyribonuclease IV [Propionibacteriaceae bacterium]
MSILIGSHVSASDAIEEARVRDAQLAQFFLGSPQRWSAPSVSYPGGAAALKADAAHAGVGLYVHAAYLINIASPNPKVRFPSRKLLQDTCTLAGQVGAKGVIVHGGHVTEGAPIETGYDNWFKMIDSLETEVPLLIENTAGGKHAMARYCESLARLWERISSASGFAHVGFCLDTCHAHAAGELLDTLVERVKAITGRIDLVHANDSRDAFGSGADRHTNLGAGTIDPDALVAVVREAACDALVETPNGAEAQAADIAWLRDRL